ncbi:putative Solute carrier family 25 member 46 [Hypsibius exemplaris]|uniref:Solute carrier family 25 member 46 n=1 Tax=Hypsibius exemplaris TaxID=2072580 RepID=A0A1W0WCZ5_HYPEX|nr:putative Solute carrier family 25 member 46 [Hypsibius exemplaris]
MAKYRSYQICETDPDLLDEDTSEITVSSGIIDVAVHRVLVHPFIVLRRQCQVNAWSRKSHVLPFTLVPVVYKLVTKQKIESLIKGLHGVLILDFTTFICEGLISVYSGLPSYALHHQEWNVKLQHYAVKFIAACVTAPMYAAAVQLTVQTIRGRESWNAVDFLKLVAGRYSVWQAPSSGHPLRRTMPVWIIAPLYGGYVVLRLFVASSVQWRLFIWSKHRNERRYRLVPDVADHRKKDITNAYLQTTNVSIASSTRGTIGNIFRRYVARATALVVADLLLYPLETVLNRLCVQGTRAAIDNLDTGVDSIPTVYSFRNPLQCASSILKSNGVSGFYRGVGAVALQVGAYVVIFGSTKVLLSYLDLEDRKTEDKD